MPLGVGTRNRKKPLNKFHWFLIKIFASSRTGGRLVLSSIPASFETSPQVWNESEQSIMLVYQRPIWAIHLLATRRQAVQPDFVGQVLRPHMFKNPAHVRYPHWQSFSICSLPFEVKPHVLLDLLRLSHHFHCCLTLCNSFLISAHGQWSTRVLRCT